MPTLSVSRAALWMAGWLAATLTLTLSGRELTVELPVFVVMLWRSLLSLAVTIPFILWYGGEPLRTRRLPWHLARNIVHYSAQYCWFLAISLIPLAEVISIEFTLPIWTAILASLFLGEKIDLRRTASIALGFAGILIIVRPGINAVGLGQIAALYAAVMFAVGVVMTKSLMRTESALTVIVYMHALQALLGFLPAWEVWEWPPAEKWPWVVALGVAGAASHFCLAKAMSSADASVVVPMDFLRVPVTAIAGWLLYSEGIDGFLIAGAGLILLGNVLNLGSTGTPAIRSMPAGGTEPEETGDGAAPPDEGRHGRA